MAGRVATTRRHSTTIPKVPANAPHPRANSTLPCRALPRYVIAIGYAPGPPRWGLQLAARHDPHPPRLHSRPRLVAQDSHTACASSSEATNYGLGFGV